MGEVSQSLSLSLQIQQWYSNETHEIGVYEPNYDDGSGGGGGGGIRNDSGEPGRLLAWKGHNIRWQTEDGAMPADHSKDCSILSDLATALDVDCERAIILAFVMVFGVLLVLLALLFFVFKRRYIFTEFIDETTRILFDFLNYFRYENRMKQTEERMRALGLLTPTSLLTLDEWEIPR